MQLSTCRRRRGTFQRRFVGDLGLILVSNTSAEYADMIRKDMDRYAAVIKEGNIKLD